MTTGRDPPRLSERLQAMKTASEAPGRIEAAVASMNSQLESFRTDCAALLNSALSTISADTQTLVTANRREMVRTIGQIRTDLNLIGRLTRFGPAMAAIVLTVWIAATFAISFFWSTAMIATARNASLSALGLFPNQTTSGLAVTWDPAKLRLGTCQAPDQSIPCLVPVQEP